MKNQHIEEEMLLLKRQLEHTAEQHQYDFCHPDVLAVSQQLDQVIVRLLHDQFHPKS